MSESKYMLTRRVSRAGTVRVHGRDYALVGAKPGTTVIVSRSRFVRTDPQHIIWRCLGDASVGYAR